MSIDIIIIGILIVLAIFGYMKGIISGIINLVFMIGYLYFSTNILNVGLDSINNDTLSQELSNNSAMQYIVIAIVGIILMFIVNLLVRKFIKRTIVSKLDKICGVILFVGIGYVLICVANMVISTLIPFFDFSTDILDSFFLSSSFNDYNFIYRWWLNA